MTVEVIIRFLRDLADEETLTDDQRTRVAVMLLRLGTRSEWRDAMFYADIDGEAEPDDQQALFRQGGYLTTPELALTIRSFAAGQPTGVRDVGILAAALLDVAEGNYWIEILQALTC